MAGLLVKRFLEKTGKRDNCAHEAFEHAFYLPKVNRPEHISLTDTDYYCMPTHTVQRASMLLNETMKDISRDSVVANIQEIIKKKESAIANR